MQNTIQYRRLSNREREEISRFIAAGIAQAEIARRLRRNPSTVSREVRRNVGGRVRSEYRAFSAGRRAHAAASSRRFGKSRLATEARLREFVLAGLMHEWSPREIQERLTKEYPLGYDHAHFSRGNIPLYLRLAARRASENTRQSPPAGTHVPTKEESRGKPRKPRQNRRYALHRGTTQRGG